VFFFSTLSIVNTPFLLGRDFSWLESAAEEALSWVLRHSRSSLAA
jgi:hypothetical protein